MKAGIVGLGAWGRILVGSVHGKSGLIRFVEGVTRTPSKAARFGEETGIPVSADLDALLRNPEIEAVVLATPHSQHVAQVKSAAAAGKHVFVEKPLALTAAGVNEAFDACERAGVVLAVGQNRRFLPAVLELRKLIEGDRLGRVIHMEGNFSGPSGYRHRSSSWRARQEESPSGGMTGKGLHITDLMISLCGEIAEVDARSLRQVLDFDFDDTTIMLLRFAAGMTGYLATMTATAAAWRLQVFGSKGWAELRGPQCLVTKFIDGDEETRQFEPYDIERAELEAFARAVAGDAVYPVSRADAVNNIALLEAIDRSAQKNAPAAIPRSAA